jgi:2-succinyl-5-enolpyruvyl-6-hydroxy-3-cyclohexene-1-carboxylate synthase
VTDREVRDLEAVRTALAGAGPGALAATFAATLVDEWVRAGITDAVVCPGSRSTPVALALAANPGIRVHVHPDERSAAFTALGLGRATGRPSPVVTTSGTAAAELHAAVIEADLDRVPLLAVTADRPPELRDVGAPQAIDQVHLFGRSVRWFADPGPPGVEAVASWRSIASRAVLESVGSPAGPVHLNLAFREPLVGVAPVVVPGRPDGRPWHALSGAAPEVAEHQVTDVVDTLAGQGSRGVIVAGGGIADPDGVLELAAQVGWPVLADPRSGCRRATPASIAHADPIARADTALRRADVVLRLGSPPASKVLTRWLDDLDGPQVLVDADATWLDPGRTTTVLVQAEPGALCRALVGRLDAADESWLHAWRAADDAVEQALESRLDGSVAPTEPGTARAVVAGLPADSALVISSSMPVRDVEWWAGPLGACRVHVNRGANGIDGVVSTAVGVALAGRPTVLLIGDVALLHDTNGLLGAAARDLCLCIVVVDNDGGGIFSFLPQAEELAQDRFEQLFGTPHGVDVEALAAVHGVEVLRAGTAEDVTAAVGKALTAPGVRLLRVRTDRAANVALHDELNTAAVDVVTAATRDLR